jgi:hypothetical protein
VTVTHTVTSTHTVINDQVRTVPGPTVTANVTAPAATVTQTVPAPSPSQASSGGSGQGKVIAKFNGSGTQNTGTFTTPGNWALSWAYWGCPGGTSNFQVTEYNSDGSLDLNGVSVNELGTGRGPVATYAYGDAGTHYLSVNTEGCSWSLVPVTV